MTLARVLTALTATATLALGLTACSPGSESELDYEDSPLNAYFAIGTDTELDEDAWIEDAKARDAEIEELVAVCVTEQGFEYTPFTGNYGYGSSDGQEWKPDDRKWVEQYGYGAINWPGRDDEPVIDESPENPNDAYVMSLSESEQAAYSETLYGPQPPEEAYADEEFDWNAWYEEHGEGCQGDAREEVDGENADPSSSEEFEPLMDALQSFYESTSDAPALSALNAEWASCMADAGHAGFTKREEAQNSIYDAQNAYWEEQNEAMGDTADWTDEDWQKYDEENEASRKAFEEELMDKEIALALADLDCREETDFNDASLRIQFELEEQFIQDHQAELDAYKAAAEQAAAKQDEKR